MAVECSVLSDWYRIFNFKLHNVHFDMLSQLSLVHSITYPRLDIV